jgi:hypothetical protein
MATRKEKKSSEVEAFLWRLVVTFIGLIVACVFLRNRSEIMKEYQSLKKQSPFTAWFVKWTFILLMLFTTLSLAALTYTIYRVAQQ